ncbi:MAG: hypothetical protein GDA48_19320 [Hormoscilla sp. GM102CHS1]|nr:hypothetical protein [Hormoscilla sp. GM102CHS1]
MGGAHRLWQETGLVRYPLVKTKIDSYKPGFTGQEIACQWQETGLA